jgi:hypothetical protein
LIRAETNDVNEAGTINSNVDCEGFEGDSDVVGSIA